MPDGSDGTYYVTVPANVTFTGLNDTADMTVKLHRTDVTKTIESTLEVKVDVYSANDYQLKSGTYPNGVYELRYSNTINNSSVTAWDDTNTTKMQNTANTGASAANGKTLGTLKPDNTNLNVTPGNGNDDKSMVGFITGQAKMTVEPTVDTQGVAFTDTLTYYVTQTKPTVQP